MIKSIFTLMLITAITLIACDSMKPNILLTVPDKPKADPLYCGYIVVQNKSLWLLIVPEDTPYTDEFIPPPFNSFDVYELESRVAGFVSLLDSTLEFNVDLVGKQITLLIDEHNVIPLERIPAENRVTLADYMMR